MNFFFSCAAVVVGSAAGKVIAGRLDGGEMMKVFGELAIRFGTLACFRNNSVIVSEVFMGF